MILNLLNGTTVNNHKGNYILKEKEEMKRKSRSLSPFNKSKFSLNEFVMSGGLMLHSQGLSNNSYPEVNKSNFSH